jgi:hypothetical protein
MRHSAPMIRVIPGGTGTVADTKLARIEPVSAGIRATQWEQHGQYPRGQKRRKAPQSARARLLAALLPGVDASECEVECGVDERGEPSGVIVRDRHGRVLARLTISQLATMEASGDQGGILFEQRG